MHTSFAHFGNQAALHWQAQLKENSLAGQFSPNSFNNKTRKDIQILALIYYDSDLQCWESAGCVANTCKKRAVSNIRRSKGYFMTNSLPFQSPHPRWSGIALKPAIDFQLRNKIRLNLKVSSEKVGEVYIQINVIGVLNRLIWDWASKTNLTIANKINRSELVSRQTTKAIRTWTSEEQLQHLRRATLFSLHRCRTSQLHHRRKRTVPLKSVNVNTKN